MLSVLSSPFRFEDGRAAPNTVSFTPFISSEGTPQCVRAEFTITTYERSQPGASVKLGHELLSIPDIVALDLKCVNISVRHKLEELHMKHTTPGLWMKGFVSTWAPEEVIRGLVASDNSQGIPVYVAGIIGVESIYLGGHMYQHVTIQPKYISARKKKTEIEDELVCHQDIRNYFSLSSAKSTESVISLGGTIALPEDCTF